MTSEAWKSHECSTVEAAHVCPEPHIAPAYGSSKMEDTHSPPARSPSCSLQVSMMREKVPWLGGEERGERMEAGGQRSLMKARTRHGVWKPVMGLSKEHSQRSGQESQQHFGLIPDTY